MGGAMGGALTLVIKVPVSVNNNNNKNYDLFSVPSDQAWCYVLPSLCDVSVFIYILQRLKEFI